MRMALAAALLLAASHSDVLGADHEWAARALEVNRESVAKLGIDLRGVSLLFDADDSSFSPKWGLEHDGKMPSLKKLELGGFVKVEIVRGLPDGSEPNEEFVTVRRTPKGEAVIRALSGR